MTTTGQNVYRPDANPMEKDCYELNPDGRLVEADYGEAVEKWRAGDAIVWIDLHDYDNTQLEDVLDELEINEFIKRRCLSADGGNVVVALSDCMFGEWPVYGDRARTTRVQNSVVCMKNLLITMHREPIEGVGDVRAQIDMLALENRGATSLLASLLFHQASVSGRAARALRDRVLELSRKMDSGQLDDASDMASEVDDLKTRILLCEAVAEEQAEAFILLSRARSAGFDAEALAAPLSLITTTARATSRLIDRVDGRAENLVRRYQDGQQERLNRRLALLTIVSAIFLPLTLLAGIWGMNFENMPELDNPNAYYMALGSMGAVAFAGFFYFYKRGWFD